MNRCEHGHDCQTLASADEDERSSCCGAPVSFSGDGDLYCKCCYASIVAGDEVAAIVVPIQ